MLLGGWLGLGGLLWGCGAALKIIDNGLAPPEVVVQPVDAVFEPKCEVTGKKLDLIFVLDSSGSLKDNFDEVNSVIARILNVVAVGPEATRVALINFSGLAKVEFSFNKFMNKRLVLDALKELRSLKGITKLGEALQLAVEELEPSKGARGPEVPKVVFLLSDGRTAPTDYDLAESMPSVLRGMFPRGVLDIFVYGTGEHVAMTDLRRYVDEERKMVTSQTIERIELLFDDFKGHEICEDKPVCIPGSDKPLDLIFILDSSSSVGTSFRKQVEFLQRLLTNMNLHPDAIRLALITFSSFHRVVFDWNHRMEADEVSRRLDQLTPRRGTTNTRLALQQAQRMFTTPWMFGGREGVPKMIIVLTDGHSRTRPQSVVSELINLQGVTIYAISVNNEERIDYRELVQLTGGIRERVFTADNLRHFEESFIPQHIGFGCPGFEGADPASFIQAIRGSVKTRCERNVFEATIRTKRPFAGWLYVKDKFHDVSCIARGDDTNEVKLTILDGQCGVRATTMEDPFHPGRTGYTFNVTVMLQFHPEIITNVDQALEVSCFHEQFVPPQLLSDPIRNTDGGASIKDASCHYHLEKYARDCVALDARVGEILHHDWECNYKGGSILVHDCFVESDEKTLEIIDHDGCAVDPFILETPKYFSKPGTRFLYKAKQSAYAWKFPTAGSLRFRCKISLCDMEGGGLCRYKLQPRCPSFHGGPNDVKRTKRQAPHPFQVKEGFDRTIDVETRRLNVLENEALKPEDDVKYCSTSYV